jgi:hypothetical protein
MVSSIPPKSHVSRDNKKNPECQICLERKVKGLLRAQASGKYFNNQQKQIIACWQHAEQHRAQEVAV